MNLGTQVPCFRSLLVASIPVTLTLSEAAKVRDANGLRRYGSADALRRRVKSGSLPAEKKAGKFFVSSAESAAEKAYQELRAAAQRAAALAPQISAERRELIASILLRA